TRIVPGGDISEFPYFTYLFADLHPHLMAFPMTAAALAFAVQLVRGGYSGIWRRILAGVSGGLLLGAIAATNPWDYPTYLVVIALGALIGALGLRRRLSWSLVTAPLFWIIGLAAVSFVLYLPFKQSYQTVFSTGIGLVRNITPAVLYSGGLCGPNVPQCPSLAHDVLVTPLSVYLQQFGLFLFIALGLVVSLASLNIGPGRAVRRWGLQVRFAWYYRDRIRRLWHASTVASRMKLARTRDIDSTVFWSMIILLLLLIFLQFYLLAFLVGMLGLISMAAVYAGRAFSPARTFVLGLFALGVMLSLVTQIFYVKDFLDQSPAFRMNTIFKFYNQTWVLFAVASACALYYIMERELRPHLRVSRVTPRVRHARRQEVASPTMALSMATGDGTLGPLHVGAFPQFAASSSGTRLDAPTSPGEHVNPVGKRLSRTLPPKWRIPGEKLLSRPLALLDRHRIWASCLVVLLAGSLIYTYAGTVARQSVRADWLPAKSVPFTLDGMAFMKVAYPFEYRAINWINDHVSGAPVITEAPNSYYDWRSRVSTFTGLPSIINGIHEPEQRFADEIDATALCNGTRDPSACLSVTYSRTGDAISLYDSPSVSNAWRIIRTYGVKYIYVGFSERQCVRSATPPQCFSRAGLVKFPAMVGHGLRVAYRNPGVTIYEVTRA
ncbi:MAG: DUF2298 domain-containing protein, partial [Chloroflexota bacterium]